MLKTIEALGNRLPHPVLLFLLLALVVVAASVVAHALGASGIHPATGETIMAVNLLSADTVRRMLVEMPKTFTGFPPLGTVLTVMIGIGIAERSGLIAAALGGFVRAVPQALLALALTFAGIMSSLAVDAGYVVLVPLGAAIFAAAGRHPLAGLAAAFAGVSGGYSAIVALTAIGLALLGVLYGRATGRIQSGADAVRMAEDAMASMASYILLAFMAAHFIAFFAWSNLGAISAIHGAGALRQSGLGGIPLLVGVVTLTAFLNLFMGSASAKWAILSTVFVPMFMLLGIAPEATQAAYRIGDSVTNIITPLMSYFPLALVAAARYVPGMGIGTMIATMLPYSIAFYLVGVVMLLAFLLLGLPIGPGVAPFLAAA